MAVLHAKGALAMKIDFRHQSILGNVHTGPLVETVEINRRKIIVRPVPGTNGIFGITILILDHDDPFVNGFTVGDIWARSLSDVPNQQKEAAQ